MKTMDIYDDEEKSGLNYLARKYGRIGIIISIFVFSIFISLSDGMKLNLSGAKYGSGEDKNVAIRGSKKVNPSTTSEYWTSSKFDF